MITPYTESGFSSEVGPFLPLGSGIVGNIQRFKSQDVKAIFVVGCNDGILPSDCRMRVFWEQMSGSPKGGADLGGNTELLAADE